MGFRSFFRELEDQVKNEAENFDDLRRENPILSAMIPFTPENQALMAGGGALLGGGMALGGALGAGGAAGAAGGTAAGTTAAAGTGAIAGAGGMLGANGLMNLANLGVGLYGANQAGKAADAQANAAYESNANQLAMYNQNRADQMPWMQQGKTSLERLAELMQSGGRLSTPFSMKDYQKTPNYEFVRGEGIRGIENSMAGRSGFGGGNMLKALARYNSGLASNEYQNSRNNFNEDQTNIFNRLSSLAGTGQTTAANLGAAGQNFANQSGQGLMNAADARAQGYTANANALSGTVNNAIGLYAANKNKLFG